MQLFNDLDKCRILFADFETSLINKEQLQLDAKDRNVYAYMVSYKYLNDDKTYCIANGKNTMRDFINYLYETAKELSRAKKKLLVYFHNLEYDWSYISYYIQSEYDGYVSKLNSFSIDEIRSDGVLYAGQLYYNYRTNNKKIYKSKDKKYNKCDKNGNTLNNFRRYTIEFRDTYHLFPLSVKKLGKVVNLEKLEYGYKVIRDYNYKVNEIDIEYCNRDVEIIEKFYRLAPDYSKKKLTIASNSMCMFKELTFPIKINGFEYDFDKLFAQDKKDYKLVSRLGSLDGRINEYNLPLRDIYSEYQIGYCGGICQVNKLHQGKMITNEEYKDKHKLINQLKKSNREYEIVSGKDIIIDVNSLYPSIMYSAKIPYGTPVVIDFPSEKKINQYVNEGKFVKCKFTSVCGELKDNKMPIVPVNRFLKNSSNELYREELTEEIIYMNYEEFLLVKEHYDLFEYTIEQCIVYNTVSGVIFKNYIDFFMKIKMDSTIKGDEVMRQISKLFLNSLYGKFGISPNKVSSRLEYNEEEGWINNKNLSEFYLNEKEEIEKIPSRENSYLFPILASAITSYARIFLINTIDRLPYNSFLYCDTDSIHFIDNNIYGLNDFINDGLIDKTQMLKYDLEHKALSSIYLAPKKYSFIDENYECIVKCAGLPADVQNNINIDDFYYGFTTEDKLSKCRSIGGIYLANIVYQIKYPKWLNNNNINTNYISNVVML